MLRQASGRDRALPPPPHSEAVPASVLLAAAGIRAGQGQEGGSAVQWAGLADTWLACSWDSVPRFPHLSHWGGSHTPVPGGQQRPP